MADLLERQGLGHCKAAFVDVDGDTLDGAELEHGEKCDTNTNSLIPLSGYRYVSC